MKITLRQLEIFTAVAHYGQVTRAAAAVALTQAAASMALADLERQLGAPLFDRHQRQLTLNANGRRLLKPAQQLLDRARDFEWLARSPDVALDLRLGASVTIGNHLLPALVAQLRRDHPDSTVAIARGNTEQVLAKLRAFELDAGFIEGPAAPADMHRIGWQRDRLQCFVAPADPRAGKPLGLNQLRDAKWIVREPGSGTREVFERACAAAGFAPRISLELEQPEAIRHCVRARLGVGCLSQLELADSFTAGSLVPLQTPPLQMERELSIVVQRGRFIGYGLRTLLELAGVGADAIAALSD